jgi:hypothetical protein
VTDLDERIDAILEHHEERERERKKKEAASDPDALWKAMKKAIDRVDRQRRLDEVREHVEIRILEC